MAKDIHLQDSYDTSIIFNDLELVDDTNEVEQSVLIRIRTLLGEQFDDTRLGVPWLTDMNSTLIQPIVKRYLLTRIIQNTHGIASIEKAEIDISVTGTATFNFEATTNTGEFFENSLEIEQLINGN